MDGIKSTSGGTCFFHFFFQGIGIGQLPNISNKILEQFKGIYTVLLCNILYTLQTHNGNHILYMLITLLQI